MTDERRVQGRNSDYRLDRIETDIKSIGSKVDALSDRMETRMEGVKNEIQTSRLALPENYVRRTELAERFANLADDTAKAYSTLEKRINDLEGTATWLMRLLVASLITGAVSLIFAIARSGLLLKPPV